MTGVLHHRGPDENGTYLTEKFALAHTRLSIIDLSTGQQPMIRTAGGSAYAIVYNGEIYNMEEVRNDLLARGWTFETTSDTEIILVGYMQYGPGIAERLNGIFAFAIADEREKAIFLCRDRSGVKPLFYSVQEDGTLVFSSEIKDFLHIPHPPAPRARRAQRNIQHRSGQNERLRRIFGRGRTASAHYLFWAAGPQFVPYWRLESRPHEDSLEITVEKTGFLVQDAIRRQMVSDVPICTFLSGGVDSSIVSAVCARELKKSGKRLATFSFDFVSNDQFYKPNAFQPTLDRPFVDIMVDFLGSDHHYLECSNIDLADYLYTSVDARDLPAMADVDSSLLYFCAIVKKYNKVVLTGECADEIFGGYPWFHREEFIHSNTFPWTPDLAPRKAMLSDEFLSYLRMDDYVRDTYEASVARTPRLAGESPEEARRREIAYLNLTWFMQTLLDRMDRTSMYSGLEARVPYADHRIIEYLWNIRGK
jgi:asparagine synthase (glutamine-hydrolysing)